MKKDDVAGVLQALATGDKSRSETARLRDVIGEVEAALAAGVSRAAILEALHGQGFTMTLKGFESALYRIRKARAKQPQPAPAMAPAATSAASGSATVDCAIQNQSTPGGPQEKKVGDYNIPKPKKFVHNPKPDDGILD